MNHNYAATAIPLLAGVVLLFQLPQLPDPEWSIIIFPLLLISYRLPKLTPLLWLLVGFLWAAFQADLRLSVTLPESVEGRDLQLVGEVVNLPQQRPSGAVRFLFKIESARYQGEWVNFPATIRLNWHHAYQPLEPDQRWQLTVRLKQPHGFSNPGGFDWERWLFEKGIRATGYVRKGNNQLLQQPSATLNGVRHQLSLWVGSIDTTGVLAALVVGDRQGIDTEQWDTLRNTGTSHLMAISGLHIGLVATLFFFLFRWGWSISPRLLLYLPAQQMGAAGAIFGALGYAALAGFSVPTQRAVVMVIVVMGLILLRRSVTPWRGYFAAMVAVLLFDPFSVLSAGFWLSFGAVGWILYALPDADQRKSMWVVMIQMQGVLLLGMLPLLLYLFQQGSLIAPLANLVIVPWVSLLVVPLTLLSALLHLFSLPGADLLLSFSSHLLQWCWPLLEWFSALPFSHFSTSQPTLWMVILALTGVAVALNRNIGWYRWLALSSLLPLFLWPQPRPSTGEAWVTVLDVGQGLATVVETHEKVMVYDTGDRFSSTFNAGSAVVAPFLHARGWKQIDLLVISHDDRDHIGGMDALLQQFLVVEAISSVPEQVDNSSYCEASNQWVWSGVVLQLLHPRANDGMRGNDRSCVIRIEASGETALLTGDIESAAETALLNYSPTAIDVDTVVVPHHGSHTSSTLTGLEAVSPRWAIIPSGYRNRYRLPREVVVRRYREQGVKFWNSADSGAVRIPLGSDESPSAWREQNLKIWSDRPQS